MDMKRTFGYALTTFCAALLLTAGTCPGARGGRGGRKARNTGNAGSGESGSWHVKEAPIRFALDLTRSPTHESAGYFAHLPDGGLLPTPFPATQVVSKRGNPLDSSTLWHNRTAGMAIVFEDPGRENEVYVYVTPSRELRLWTPASKLTPSSILCANPAAGTLDAAVNLSKLGSVGPTVNYRDHIGIPNRAPLSIGGDLSGRPKPCSFYLLSHVVTSDPGKTWIAPFNLAGQCEVRVNGTTIVPKKRTEKWGGAGQYVNLKKGLNRVEVFHAIGGQGSFSTHAKKGGLMYLAWKTPNATLSELGGTRPRKAPMGGTSKWEARVLYDNEIAHSGHCKVAATRFQDGAPVPHIDMHPLEVYWFGGEAPVIVYELTAGGQGNPQGTTYTWDFGGGATLTRRKLLWPFLGGRENMVTLTASADGKQKRCKKPFFGFATLRSSLEDARTRAVYRKAALTVLEAYPGNVDPTANWDTSIWNNFFRTMDLGKGQELLTHIFSVRWGVLSAKLPPEKRQQLLDIFLDFLPRVSPAKALQWIDRLEKEARRDRNQADLLKVARAEVQMYYLNELDAARKSLVDVIRLRGTSGAAELARIRCGDIEFIKGNLNEATKIYADVQNRVNRSRTHGSSSSSLGGSSRLRQSDAERRREWLSKAPSLAKAYELPVAEEKAEPKRGRRRPGRGQEPEVATAPTFKAAPNAHVQDWKLNALLDVSASENIKTLIDQGYLLEAKRGLQMWERESPMSKVSGDFILNEAALYMKLGDYARARAMLMPYCQHVDASSFFPAATEALLTCMVELDEPKDKVMEFYEKVKKKLEFHPAAKELEDIVNSL